MASSWSSSSSMDPGGRRGEGSSAPIPYREGPLEYSPPTMCKCLKKAARWISWSNDNPGRRYFTCYHRREGGCNFWCWFDPRPSPFLRELLVDLRHTVWALKRQNRELMNQLADAAVTVEEHKGEVTVLRAEMEALAKEKEEGSDVLRIRLSRVEKELAVYKVMVKCCVVFVLGIVMNKWLLG